MRSYELMMIVKPDLDEEATRGVVDKALGVISGNGGNVVKEDIWGKRRLAYDIGGIRDGFYAVIQFQGPPKLTAELDRVLRITDDVVRHMVVVPETESKKEQK